MATSQPRRLSYTRRDVASYHEDVSTYLRAFNPRITEVREGTEARLYLTAFEGLTDNANYANDHAANEARADKAEERKNLLSHAYAVDYKPIGVSAATVDAVVSMLSGVAPPGGQAVPIYSRFQSRSPQMEFLSAADVTILEGTGSVAIPLIQGQRSVAVVLTASASGLADQRYRVPVPNTPDAYIEVGVNAVSWTRPQMNDLSQSNSEDQHFYTQIDADNYTWVCFGDGVAGDDQTAGLIPPAGAQVTVTYIQCLLAQGNVASGQITTVVGALAGIIGINNTLGASGGADAEELESIRKNLASNHQAFERAVKSTDYEYFARRVAGVYDAYAVHVDGPLTEVYIMPQGGGTASSTLLTQVTTELTSRGFEGCIVYSYALDAAHVLAQANMVLKASNVQKATARLKARVGIVAALDYTQVRPGSGWKMSDLDAIFENLEDGTLVDFVDLVQLSRVPRIIKSNLAAPDVQGRVQIREGVGYSTILLQALTTTSYLISVDGTPQAAQGTVGISYTTDDGFITLTLGTVMDTLTPGNFWTIKTSKYRDNMVIDPDEYMDLDLDSDIQINVFYPGEYSLTTHSAV